MVSKSMGKSIWDYFKSDALDMQFTQFKTLYMSSLIMTMIRIVYLLHLGKNIALDMQSNCNVILHP